MMKDKNKIRASVVLELINSERDYVKHLGDVVEGYLYPARRHPEIFSSDRINIIFSNIEQLYEFQKQFLQSLEKCINWDNLALSEVGDCFLRHKNHFSIYYHYCNNHPNASHELQDLYTKQRFIKFFEACRLIQNMIDISLDGFLLTPIQRICKYPLQLNELLKNTDEEHPDFQMVSNALETMRNCANLANERKRRIEALADLIQFQERFLGQNSWFGKKLGETSSILIHSGEVSKLTLSNSAVLAAASNLITPSHSSLSVINSSGSAAASALSWSQNNNWGSPVQLYLFDHLLIYAKKDLLKRNNQLILKGRINIDSITEISDADEYKPKKSFKLFDSEQQKWFIFITKTEEDKDNWIKAFERERNLIESDENEGFRITDRELNVAKKALQNRKHSRSARTLNRYHGKDSSSGNNSYSNKLLQARPDTAVDNQELNLDDAITMMNRTLSLPSCIHPSHVLNFVEESRVISTSPNSSNNRNNPNINNVNGHKSSTNGNKHRDNPANNFLLTKPFQAPAPTSSSNLSSSTIHMNRQYLIDSSRRQSMENNSTNNIQWSAAASMHKSPTFKQDSDNHHSILKPATAATRQATSTNKLAEEQQSNRPDSESPNGTFETTLVLSSGRVVRVREDAV